VLVADTGNRCIRAIDSAGNVTTIAGDPSRSGPHDGPKDVASFSHPTGIALGLKGSLFVADGNAGVRAIAPDGTISTLTVPFGPAIGIASWPVGDGALYVASRDGLWLVDLTLFAAGTPGAVYRFRPGMLTFEPHPSAVVNELVAHGQHAVGVPFGVGAFTGVGVAYTDVMNHRVRYADPLRGDIDVIGGGAAEDAADEGGYADGPTRQSRFDEPTGVAVAADGTVAVADTGNKRIRLIRGVDRSGPLAASSEALTTIERRPNEYRIGFIGGSVTWGSGPFEVSPAAAIEHRLAADGALSHIGKTARVVTVDAGSNVAALRSYIDLVAEARTFDCVVIMVTAWDPIDSYGIDSTSLDASAPRWVPRLTKDLAELKRVLDAARIPSLFVAVPVASELGTTVFAAAIGMGATGGVEPDGARERLATAPLANAKLNWFNAWDLIQRDMQSADHRPVYLSWDGHFTTYGNQLIGNAIAKRLEADGPWSRGAK
jgi:hypothetical protein